MLWRQGNRVGLCTAHLFSSCRPLMDEFVCIASRRNVIVHPSDSKGPALSRFWSLVRPMEPTCRLDVSRTRYSRLALFLTTPSRPTESPAPPITQRVGRVSIVWSAVRSVIRQPQPAQN